MAQTETERLAEKTAERQFPYELERDWELAPAASWSALGDGATGGAGTGSGRGDSRRALADHGGERQPEEDGELLGLWGSMNSSRCMRPGAAGAAR